jgi:hypothetical protein
MRPPETISSGIAASVLAHVSALVLVLLFTEVHTFGFVTAEPITVDLVSQAEAVQSPKDQEPVPEQQRASIDTPEVPANPAVPSSPPAAPPAAVAPEKNPAPSRPSPGEQHATATPAKASSSPQVFTRPEPDLSIKYNVMLGLPPALPVAAAKSGTDDLFDASASEKVRVESSLIGEFRSRLKSCSKLPPSIAPSDKVTITLRAFMTSEGRLATEPILIEGSASDKGPALMQSAIRALEACQPYAMLPADRYGEWKVLDLSFTPQDFLRIVERTTINGRN